MVLPDWYRINNEEVLVEQIISGLIDLNHLKSILNDALQYLTHKLHYYDINPLFDEETLNDVERLCSRVVYKDLFLILDEIERLDENNLLV